MHIAAVVNLVRTGGQEAWTTLKPLLEMIVSLAPDHTKNLVQEVIDSVEVAVPADARVVAAIAALVAATEGGS
jgi:hypothetical protein